MAVGAQDGTSLSVVGDVYRIVISSEQTNGVYALIDMLIPQKGGGLYLFRTLHHLPGSVLYNRCGY
jgi:hypothetical protein